MAELMNRALNRPMSSALAELWRMAGAVGRASADELEGYDGIDASWSTR